MCEKEITCVYEVYNNDEIKTNTLVFWDDETVTIYYGKQAKRQPKIEEFKQLCKEVVVRAELKKGGYTLTYDIMNLSGEAKKGEKDNV